MKVISLAPKMAAQFAERAKRGEADYKLGAGIYLFFQGNQEICLVSLNPPQGHIHHRTTEETKRVRADLAQQAAHREGAGQ